MPRIGDQTAIWSTGLMGAASSLWKAWLDRYADLMLVLGGVLVPVGGVLLAHFFVTYRRPADGEAQALYNDKSLSANGGVIVPGVHAWGCGTAAYYASRSIGSTTPSLVAAMIVYVVLRRREDEQTASLGRT